MIELELDLKSKTKNSIVKENYKFYQRKVIIISAQIVMIATSKSMKIKKYIGMINYQQIITRDPNKRFGKPCIRETRISVYDVLNWLANEMSIKEIVTDFPELTEKDVLACLAYAADKEHKIENVK